MGPDLGGALRRLHRCFPGWESDGRVGQCDRESVFVAFCGRSWANDVIRKCRKLIHLLMPNGRFLLILTTKLAVQSRQKLIK